MGSVRRKVLLGSLLCVLILLIGCNSAKQAALYSGIIEGTEIQIQSELGGMVKHMALEEGDTVAQNQTVAELIPYIGIGILSFTIVLAVGVLWFGVAAKGSYLLLLTLSLLFLITTLVIGILISTVSKTQLQAMQLAFATILPSVLLSGFIFPRETMPLFLQWIGNLIPLTYFIEILRGIFLKEVGLAELWQETVSLAMFACALILLAISRFRKKLD